MKTAAIALLLCSAPALAAPCGTPQACAAGCDRHDAHACNDLAVMFEEGRGVPKDLPKAAMLYEVACNHGVLEACSFFATFLYNGEVVPKDVARAAVLLKRACDGGNVAESCEHLKAVAAAAAREQRATTTCDGVNDTYRRLKQDRGFDSRAGLDDDLALLHGIKRPRGMGEPQWRSCVQTLDQKLRKQSAEAQEYLATHRDSPAEKRRRKCERDCFYANLSAHESTADMCRQQCR